MPETLLLRHSSMHYVDDADEVRADAKVAIPHADTEGAPDFIGFTELGAQQEERIIRERCKEAGYDFFMHIGVGLAVHPKHKVREVGRIDVLDAYHNGGGSGSHQARGIIEVTVETPDENVVTVHEMHWITDGGRNRRRAAKRRHQSDRMADRVEAHSRGKRIAFWMGDTNSDEQNAPRDEVQTPLTRAGLISIYDALGTYPSTHGNRTIDVIGHHNEDRRVRPLSVEVGPRRNSDHRVVDATYRIRSPRRRR